MSRIDSFQPNQPVTGKATNLEDLDVSQFMDLLIAELRNQDPLDPVDNSEMAQQISQIREIAATDKLSSTLAAVNLTTASSLIGREVEALSDLGETVRGLVEKVTVQVDEADNSLRQYRIHIGEEVFDLDRVREVNAGG